MGAMEEGTLTMSVTIVVPCQPVLLENILEFNMRRAFIGQGIELKYSVRYLV